MRRVIAVLAVVALAVGCGGSNRHDIVLRAQGDPLSKAELHDSAASFERHLRAAGIDARVETRGSDELVLSVPRAMRLDPGTARHSTIWFYDLEAALDAQTGGRARAVSCGPPAPFCPGVETVVHSTHRYRFHGTPEASREAIEEATVDVDPATHQTVVVLALTPTGKRELHALTKELAVRGNVAGAPQHLAIVVDDRLVAWPQIDYREFPNGIAMANGVQVASLPSPHAARELALEIETAVLPTRFRVVRG